MPTSDPLTNLVWLDLEMTGLYAEKDKIVEVAVIITNKDLEILGELPPIVIHQSDEVLANMDDFCKKIHGESGLTAKVRNSTITENEADDTLLNFISEYVEPKKSPLCGSSVSTDRSFIFKYLQRVDNYLHFRSLDVSTIKELFFRWNKTKKRYYTQGKHSALDDIHESIDELKYYRKIGFIGE